MLKLKLVRLRLRRQQQIEPLLALLWGQRRALRLVPRSALRPGTPALALLSVLAAD
jgi:hypothetical protein